MTHLSTERLSATLRPLHDGWSVRALRGPIPAEIAGATVPATVPGLVHTDLLAAGLIPDPYLDQNEKKVTWIGETDWEYASVFAWSPDGHDRHELVFEGLDTVATITLNGTVVASTRNQHRTYRFAVDGLLVEGDNALVVRFASPVAEADRASLEIGYRPHTYSHPFNALRKAACNFGWDWGLDAASVGLWKPVSLHAWSEVRLAAVRPVVTVDGTTGRVAVHVDLERTTEDEVELTASVDGVTASVTVPAGERSAVLELSVEDAALWWPRGFGEQPLSLLDVEASVGGAVVDGRTLRIGFRTIEVQLDRDEEGTSFRFVVNGEPVWIRGANWIPDDAFITRVDRARLAHRMDQAEFANMNLLRIWGGGYFESDDFYELCDERGILVWQDFLFACASYAEEEPLWSEVEAEVRDNVTRIMPHPSLALWNGNNENIWGYEEWGWEKRLQGRTWGLGYYLDLLPRLVAELDPERSYTPGSPWSGDTAIFANDVDHGSVHLWELWNRVDYPAYRDVHARFVAEFGWQGPASWSTIQRSISDSPLTPESPGMIHHQKATDGNDKLTDGLVAHLPLPDDTEDWHWAMSLNQALAVTLAIEHQRSESPRCMGSVVWQLNDCWPVTSWAAVDGDGTAKPLLYALKHVYADRLLTVQPRAEGLAVVAVNDSAQEWAGEVVVRRVRFDGTVLAEERQAVSLDARSVVTVPVGVGAADDVAAELLVAELAGERAFWFFAEYRESALEAARLTTSVRAVDGGAEVTVTAENLVRDLTLLVDKVDPAAVVDDQLITLLPRESVTFRVSGAGLDPAALVSPSVLRTANQLVADWG
ncbi:glycoside hydrolase family 2 protein [Rathayibacter sp. VKM Ac-2928]|uniref:glycoside hydrolase family 2 protein n=1 Tax=Rathayibacter sp. VKM Ac-2928 TaxID=2929479 RepID=UPI001FB4B64E|nr:glycoside hydrolase family 2 protein [Rathayibacter sp. VKM Ac-2928]MCJ1683346.1 glycoside hydrolase family 2 protein [Rathayibacter sp. VKM Ac-2928]